MSRRLLTSVFTAAALALTLPLAAQEKGARPNPSGDKSGSAVARPSGGSSGSGGGSSSSARPNGGDQGHVSSGSSSSASSGDDQRGRRRAVPAYSRPRDGRPVVGAAVERSGRPPVRGGGSYYDPYYRYSYYYNRYPYGYFYPGYGYGLGYFYDPGIWGYYTPSYGYYDPYAGYGYGGGYSRGDRYREEGSIRLKVKPEHSQVYVDGYYVGDVDSFDGIFQRLTLDAGAHRIEIRAEGYLPEQFEVMVIPGETITYAGDLKRR